MTLTLEQRSIKKKIEDARRRIAERKVLSSLDNVGGAHIVAKTLRAVGELLNNVCLLPLSHIPPFLRAESCDQTHPAVKADSSALDSFLRVCIPSIIALSN